MRLAYRLYQPTLAGLVKLMVEDDITGIIIEPKNPVAIAAAVCLCLAGNNRQIMGAAAYQMAKERYFWNVLAAQTAKVYSQV
jgi:glycosyltransferase involved in cell wall biosynthesis